MILALTCVLCCYLLYGHDFRQKIGAVWEVKKSRLLEFELRKESKLLRFNFQTKKTCHMVSLNSKNC